MTTKKRKNNLNKSKEVPFSMFYEGSLLQVPTTDEILKALKCRNELNMDRINALEKENERLKSEAYKDEELLKMKKELDELKRNCQRGFPITEEEQKEIDKWIEKHEASIHGISPNDFTMKIGVLRSSYTYNFYPTQFGVCGKIKCSCGAKFEFQHIG